jgi:hypothetical protein
MAAIVATSFGILAALTLYRGGRRCDGGLKVEKNPVAVNRSAVNPLVKLGLTMLASVDLAGPACGGGLDRYVGPGGSRRDRLLADKTFHSGLPITDY